MPILKVISGHGGTAKIRDYLEKKNRTLGRDFLNLPIDEWIEEDRGGATLGIEWDREMDATREAFGTNSSWRGLKARTFKHFVISPDPKDSLDMGSLRELSQAWAMRYFPDHEIAIIYHDDNASRIPHAHVVVNNVNLKTGNRMHTDHPEDLNRDLQDMARERGLTGLSNNMPKRRAKGFEKNDPRSLQTVCFGRAEKELMSSGNYSWVGDIRSRVALAKNTSRTEAEFMTALSKLGLSVRDNSEKAFRQDWVFSLTDDPSKCVSGERLGLTYGKQMLLARFERKESYRPGVRSAQEIRRRASRAVSLNDLNDLGRLSAVIETCAKFNIRNLDDFDRRLETLRRRGNEQSKGFARLVEAKSYMTENELMTKRESHGEDLRDNPMATRMRGNQRADQRARSQEEQRTRTRERDGR